MSETKIIFTDGACKGNQQKDISKRKMYWCFVDSSRKDLPNDPIRRNFHIGTAVGAQTKYKVASNNIAELLALLECLKYCANSIQKYDDILIRMDSTIVSLWIKSGKVKSTVNAPEFTQMVLDDVVERISKFSNIKFEVISRDDNLAGHKLEELT